MTKRTQAHLAVLSANLIFSANFTIAKVVMPSLIKPYAFIFVRVAVAGALFWLLAASSAFRQKIDKKDWPRFVLCAIFGVAINQLTFFKGLSYTLPIHASLMMLTSPICVTIIAAFLIKEKVTWLKTLGLICGISGALLLVAISSHRQSAYASNIVLGDFLVFINGASYAFYLVIVKPLMKRYKPIVVIRYVFTIGFFFIIPFSFNEVREVQWQLFGTADWMALAYVVLFTTFLAYFFNVFALHTLNASTVGSYMYLQPVFAALIAMLFLGELLTWVKVVSAILIFSGVYMVSYKPKQEVVPSS